MSGNSPLKTYGWQLARAFISFGVVIIYSRYLGSSGRGEMSILLLYLQVILMFVELFAGSAMANWLVKYRPSQIIPWVALFSLSVLILSGFLIHGFFGVKWNLLIPLLIQGFSLAWLNIQYNIYQSKGLIGRRNKLQLVLELTKLILLLSVAFIIPSSDVTSMNVQSMLEVLATVTFVILCASMFKTLSVWKLALAIERPPKGIFFEGLWAQLGHFVLFLVNKAPLWLVAKYLGDSEAGIFANALLIADTIWIFSGSFGTIIHSRVIRNDRESYHQRLLSRYIEFSIIGTLIICGFLLLSPNGIFTTIFGSNFSTLKYNAILLIPGILFISMSTSIGNYLHATNRFKELLRNHCISFCILIATILIGFRYKFSIEMIAFGMNLSFLTLLILHLYTINWVFKTGLHLKFNILLIKRLISIKLRNR
jgi:hypothetical protein